jgi:transposase
MLQPWPVSWTDSCLTSCGNGSSHCSQPRHLAPAAESAPYPDRNCVAALVFMSRTSTPWALLPAKELGCGSATTCWRRFDEWARAGVFDQLQALLLDELDEAGRVGLERVSVDSFSLRAVRGGPDRRQSHDRGKAGSKLHMAASGAGCRCR